MAVERSGKIDFLPLIFRSNCSLFIRPGALGVSCTRLSAKHFERDIFAPGFDRAGGSRKLDTVLSGRQNHV